MRTNKKPQRPGKTGAERAQVAKSQVNQPDAARRVARAKAEERAKSGGRVRTGPSVEPSARPKAARVEVAAQVEADEPTTRAKAGPRAEAKARAKAGPRAEPARAEVGGEKGPSRERLRSVEERLLAAADAAQAAEKAGAASPGKRGAAAPRREAPAGTRRAVEIDEEGNAIGRVAKRERPARTTDAGEGAERPTRAANDAPAKPRRAATGDASGDAKPVRAAGDAAKPVRASGDAKPVRASGDAKPVRAAGDAAKPVRAAGDATKPVRAAKAGDAAKRSPGVTREVRGWTEGATPRKAAAPRKSTLPRRAGPERLAPAKVRLQKLLASAGVAARRKAEDLITRRRVTVNGKIASELGVKVDPDRDEIKVDGKIVQIEKKVYFVLNKPDGVVCSAEGVKDAEGRPTVLSLLQVVTQRIYPVGRLDFHSRGVLILTNDGEMAAALTHPRHEVTKTYHVKFQGRLDDAALAALGQGIALEDGTVTRPAEEVSVIKETATNTWAQITLRQGLNRQIRRMGDALGHPVLKLIRVSVGPITADGLADGEFRPLTPTEVYDLMAAALR